MNGPFGYISTLPTCSLAFFFPLHLSSYCSSTLIPFTRLAVYPKQCWLALFVVNMDYSHDEESGIPRQRHMSVSNYAANMSGNNYEGARRRSSIALASLATSQKEGVLNQKDETLRKMSVAVPNLAELTSDAKNAAGRERRMGFIEGCRLYPKAMFFSFALSLAVIMEGYDTALLGNFYGIPAFAKKFGEPAAIKNGVQTYQVSASWQSALGNGTAAAQIIGLFINGILSERIGYRKMMMGVSFSKERSIFPSC